MLNENPSTSPMTTPVTWTSPFGLSTIRFKTAKTFKIAGVHVDCQSFSREFNQEITSDERFRVSANRRTRIEPFHASLCAGRTYGGD